MLEVVCAAPERVVNLCSAGRRAVLERGVADGERLRFTTTRDGGKRR